MTSRQTLALVLGATLGLAACDSSDGDGGGDVSRGIDTLGTDFVAAFGADMDAEPIDADGTNLPAVDVTAEPFDP